MGGRSPEDRQRAAQERAARRAERARADADGRTAPTPPPAPEPEPIEPDGPEPGPVPAVSWATTGSNGGDPAEHDGARAAAERAPAPDRGRGAPPDEPRGEGAADRPPRPPGAAPAVAQAQALVPPLRRPDRAAGDRRRAVRINATFQPFVSDDEQAGAVPVQIPKGADAGSIGRLLEAKGVIDDARFFEINATVTLRRGKLITGNYVLRRHMTNGAAIEALMQGPKVRVVKTFNVGVPEGLSRREAAKVLAGSGIEGNYLKATPLARGDRPRPQARPAEQPRHDRGLPLPGHLRAQGGRHGERPGRPPARRVPRQLRLDQPEGRAAHATSAATTSSRSPR